MLFSNASINMAIRYKANKLINNRYFKPYNGRRLHSIISIALAPTAASQDQLIIENPDPTPVLAPIDAF